MLFAFMSNLNNSTVKKVCFIGNGYIYLTRNYDFPLDLIYAISPFFTLFVNLLTFRFLLCQGRRCHLNISSTHKYV